MPPSPPACYIHVVTTGDPAPIPPRELERLAQLHSEDGILTVCVGISPWLTYERHQAEHKFKGAASRFARTADERSLAVLERERHRVLDYLRGWEPHGRALVIFTCEPARVWQTYTLDI